MVQLTEMLDNRMSTYYLLLVDKEDLDDDFILSKNDVRLPNVVMAYKVILTHYCKLVE